MKKLIKTTAVFVLAAALSTTAFAQNVKKEEVPRNRERKEIQIKGGRFHHSKKNFGSANLSVSENVIIGKVKKVDTAAGKIFVTNSDGKDVEVIVSPFTKIFVETTDQDFRRMPKKQLKKLNRESESKVTSAVPAKADKLSDIQNGSWVMISTYKTDTKALIAAAVIAKVKYAAPVEMKNAE